jgi:hypothetical protein
VRRSSWRTVANPPQGGVPVYRNRRRIGMARGWPKPRFAFLAPDCFQPAVWWSVVNFSSNTIFQFFHETFGVVFVLTKQGKPVSVIIYALDIVDDRSVRKPFLDQFTSTHKKPPALQRQECKREDKARPDRSGLRFSIHPEKGWW